MFERQLILAYEFHTSEALFFSMLTHTHNASKILIHRKWRTNFLNSMSSEPVYKCYLETAILTAHSGNAMTEECDMFSGMNGVDFIHTSNGVTLLFVGGFCYVS